jgi:hypothetical protein
MPGGCELSVQLHANCNAGAGLGSSRALANPEPCDDLADGRPVATYHPRGEDVLRIRAFGWTC